MGIEWNDISSKSQGGTEQMGRRLEASLPKDLLDKFQIILSRPGDLDPTKLRVLWTHDLPVDAPILKDEGWRKFHKIVFVSYWQRDMFIREFDIPFSRCTVIHNAIEPFTDLKPKEKKNDIRLIYSTTPHRGLKLLVPVFENLAQTQKDIHLDVYSSFAIYGWLERDKEYEPLFERIKNHPQMTYHGFQPNDVIREALKVADIQAYPCIWQETSCLSLMEAMASETLCVHSDLGALPETAGNWTMMYGMQDDMQDHAAIFHNQLNLAIQLVRDQDQGMKMKLQGQKTYIDLYYNWETRAVQWTALLNSLVNLPTAIEEPQGPFFVYNVA
jgi:UDP-glucose:(glucosyl)LPS alpha-1,2-glucosyltransferase